MTSKREQCKTIAALDHIKCTWDAEWEQFRITLEGLSKARQEEVAYYTTDYEDALLTAKSMSERRVAAWEASAHG